MRLFAIAVLLAFALTPAAGVSAASSTLAQGTFSVEVLEIVSRQIGPNGPCVGTVRTALIYEGTLEGTATEIVRFVSHASCDSPPPVREELAIDGTFTGAVAGKSGSFDYRALFFFSEEGGGHGRLVIQRGSGELKGLHGVLKLAFNPDTGEFSYSGRIHFGS
jgi:hypothetical protein